MTDIDRRRLLAVGGAALLSGLAGCIFDDTKGYPGREGDGSGGEEAGGEQTGTFGPAE